MHASDGWSKHASRGGLKHSPPHPNIYTSSSIILGLSSEIPRNAVHATRQSSQLRHGCIALLFSYRPRTSAPPPFYHWRRSYGRRRRTGCCPHRHVSLRNRSQLPPLRTGRAPVIASVPRSGRRQKFRLIVADKIVSVVRTAVSIRVWRHRLSAAAVPVGVFVSSAQSTCTFAVLKPDDAQL